MAVSKTLIARLALSHLRTESDFENVESDTSSEAVAANLWYDVARRQALAEIDMGFSRKRLALATHDVDPPADWGYRYQYPADCVQARFIENPVSRTSAPVPFLIEDAGDGTMSILADTEDAVLVYAMDKTDATHFHSHFVLAFSYLLAHYMSGQITGKESLGLKALQSYNFFINAGGALEGTATAAGTEPPPEAPWIKER